MKNKVFAGLAVLVFGVTYLIGQANNTVYPSLTWDSGANVPGACESPAFFDLISGSTHILYTCNTTGHFVQQSGGSSGPSGPVGTPGIETKKVVSFSLACGADNQMLIPVGASGVTVTFPAVSTCPTATAFGIEPVSAATVTIALNGNTVSQNNTTSSSIGPLSGCTTAPCPIVWFVMDASGANYVAGGGLTGPAGSSGPAGPTGPAGSGAQHCLWVLDGTTTAVGTGSCATTVTWTDNGTYWQTTVTIPASIYLMNVQAWGAGAGGQSGCNHGCLGGGGGGWDNMKCAVTPGNTLNINVGKGMAASSGSTQQASQTSVSGCTVGGASADGGWIGAYNDSNFGGVMTNMGQGMYVSSGNGNNTGTSYGSSWNYLAGSLYCYSAFSTRFDQGGCGGAAQTNATTDANPAFPTFYGGGGGGGGSYGTVNGGNGGVSRHGGQGGDGASITNPCSAGTPPGGGGGGGASVTNTNGCAGARGEVDIDF